MREILFLKPVFKERIWGGNRMAREFRYPIPSDHTGECWAVSARPGGDCEVASGPYAGRTLSELWRQEKQLFGTAKGESFPLLVKIIDAREDLSIQVHPDDAYARAHEKGAPGKAECWYILDCKPGDTVVIGHNASTRSEMRRMIRRNHWDTLLREQPIRKGDFFQIMPGTVHAIKGGTMLLEIQQSSDVTYRLYDYGRLSNGKPRELHLEKGLEAVSFPSVETSPRRRVRRTEQAQIETLISCPYYTVEKIELWGEATFYSTEPFTTVSVTEGEGTIDGIGIRKGSHFILASRYGAYVMRGSMQFVTAHV